MAGFATIQSRSIGLMFGVVLLLLGVETASGRSAGPRVHGTPREMVERKIPHGRLFHVRGPVYHSYDASLVPYYVPLNSRESTAEEDTLGRCWKKMTGKDQCRQIYIHSVTRADCCRALAATGWGDGGWTPGTPLTARQFFDNLVVGTASDRCIPCHTSCQTLSCSDGKVCREKEGMARCLCAACTNPERNSGVVCGYDRMTYSSRCYMKRLQCTAHNKQRVDVDYVGVCQKSCDKVRCSEGKHCATDQNGHPHCITCPASCPSDVINEVCASNGVTYKSLCDLRREACLHPNSKVKFQHSGKCNVNATCADVQCPNGEKCLTDLQTNKPICVDCHGPCHFRLTTHKLCGNDGVTYAHYCAFIRESCYTGVHIGIRHTGSCNVELSTEGLEAAAVSENVESDAEPTYDDLHTNNSFLNISDYHEDPAV